jgi:hypothetical protein
MHEALLRAPSKGRYFNQSIRGRFPYGRVSHGQPERVEQDMPAERQR